MTLMVVSDSVIAVCKGQYIDYYDYSTHTTLELKLNTATEEPDFIVDVALSQDKKLLAVLLTSSKRLVIYALPSLKIIQSFILPRSASKIRFGVNNSQIFVADKTGDVLTYEVFKDDSGTKLLGHLSLLLNVLQTHDGKYIITCDRDEKIKVSCYPNTYNIQTYCLGHKEYVNHIEQIPHAAGFLLSTSGDGTMKIWNYTNGNLLHTIDTFNDIKNNEELKQEFSTLMDAEGVEINSLPIIDCTITQFDENSSIVGITIHSYKRILIYTLKTIDDAFSFKIIGELSLDNFPAAIQFYNLSLFIYDKINSEVSEYAMSYKNEYFSINCINKIQVFENQIINTDVDTDNNSIKVLFKRKYDNVQEYKERKKIRLEKK